MLSSPLMLSRVISRVRGLFGSPRRELAQTLAEPGQARAILFPYVTLVAAPGPIARYLSHGLLGTYRPAIRIGPAALHIPGGWQRAPAVALVESLELYGLSL